MVAQMALRKARSVFVDLWVSQSMNITCLQLLYSAEIVYVRVW
jgi:hypothetical protein